MSTNDQSSGAQHQWRPPTHTVRVCLAETCEAQDDELTGAIERRLGIGLEERTADGIALEGLDCIGLCGIPQAVMIDDEPVIGQYAVLLAVDELLR
jgi:NADH:ubiquinone oxidoreductase subunit E